MPRARGRGGGRKISEILKEATGDEPLIDKKDRLAAAAAAAAPPGPAGEDGKPIYPPILPARNAAVAAAAEADPAAVNYELIIAPDDKARVRKLRMFNDFTTASPYHLRQPPRKEHMGALQPPLSLSGRAGLRYFTWLVQLIHAAAAAAPAAAAPPPAVPVSGVTAPAGTASGGQRQQQNR